MDTYEVITRNSREVLPAEEVRELATTPEEKRAYVGYEPSGVLHLGHMLTANRLIDLQTAGMDVVVLLADVHAYLNGKGTFEEIHETAERMREQFVAYGLEADATEFVLGSEFQFDEDYLLDLHALGLETTLKRAQRAVADIQSGTTMVSHVVYPLMQALDIEYLDLDLAVGGMDQRKVHALQRDTLPAIGYESRPAIHTPILADLTTGLGKMSSSTNPVTGGESITISFEDSTTDIEQKVRQVFFPPEPDPDFEDYYNYEDYDLEPGEVSLYNPALQLFEYHVFPRVDRVVVKRPEEYGGDITYDTYDQLATDVASGDLHPADAKEALAGALDKLIAPGREAID
jgi:tyrosyl-tRNA synthetase